MNDIQHLSAASVDELLGALGDQLTEREQHLSLAVVGGAALLVLGLTSRVTRDVDSFYERAHRRTYGYGLEVLFASRLDQVHFKLYATADQGAGKHLADLQALEPTADELLAAARWSRTHDPSVGYRDVLVRVLAHFGIDVGPSDA